MDVEVGGGQVEVGALQAGQFAPAQAGVGGGEHEDLVGPAGLPGDDLGYLLGGGVRALRAVQAGDADAAGGVERDPPVFDGLVEHEGGHGDHVADGPGAEPAGQLGDQPFDVLAADPGQGEVAELGQDV